MVTVLWLSCLWLFDYLRKGIYLSTYWLQYYGYRVYGYLTTYVKAYIYINNLLVTVLWLSSLWIFDCQCKVIIYIYQFIKNICRICGDAIDASYKTAKNVQEYSNIIYTPFLLA